jgi:hypothetical protein
LEDLFVGAGETEAAEVGEVRAGLWGEEALGEAEGGDEAGFVEALEEGGAGVGDGVAIGGGGEVPEGEAGETVGGAGETVEVEFGVEHEISHGWGTDLHR